jgi:chromosome segregation ATPase
MDTQTQLIIDQLKRTQESSDTMANEFSGVKSELSGLRSDVQNLSGRVSRVETQLDGTNSRCMEHGENTKRFEVEIQHLKKDAEEAKRAREKIDLRTFDGWKRVAPFGILALASVLGLLRDKIVAFFG